MYIITNMCVNYYLSTLKCRLLNITSNYDGESRLIKLPCFKLVPLCKRVT